MQVRGRIVCREGREKEERENIREKVDSENGRKYARETINQTHYTNAPLR